MGRMSDAPANWKPFTRTVRADQSVLCKVKWNPKRLLAEDNATQVVTARMQVQANLINFDINTVADATIGTYSGNSGSDDQIPFADAATIQGLLDYINGIELGYTAYRAGLKDYRPGYVIGTGDAIAVALANIMLGRGHEGLEVFGDISGHAVANTFGVGVGTFGAKEGGGQVAPDLFETGYTSTTAGVVTRTRETLRQREEYPFYQVFETRIVGVHFGATYSSDAKAITIYDMNNNLVYDEIIGAGTDLQDADRYSFDNPVCITQGPAFVQATGTTLSVDGPLTVQAFVRVA